MVWIVTIGIFHTCRIDSHRLASSSAAPAAASTVAEPSATNNPRAQYVNASLGRRAPLEAGAPLGAPFPIHHDIKCGNRQLIQENMIKVSSLVAMSGGILHCGTTLT